MHPTRDIPPFLRITSALGRDPGTTPVSCRIGNIGYGGAMGPAQFIPSTWERIAPKAAAKLGIASADPWKPRDAFMASAVYLASLGADAKTYTAERNAACRYYSGRSCDSKRPANTFYGDQVANRASKIQGQIDFLESTTR
jgi:membrane-bound lytic murein transglycosylase B